jgi:pilus assembly protein FimV
MAAEHPHTDKSERKGTLSTADLGTSDDEALEQYGVWVKAGPEDVRDDIASSPSFEITDLDAQEDEEVLSSLTEEEEELLGSLEDETVPSGEDEFGLDDLPRLADSEADALTIGDIDLPDDFTIGDDDIDVSSDRDLSTTGVGEEARSGRTSGTPKYSNEEEEPMDIPEGSASILQKIEEDLLSIKAELTELKNQIYSLRGGTPRDDSSEKKDEMDSGFFEEDEDETIALTGDELDNILNTADITEQTGQSTVSPEDSDLVLDEVVSEDPAALVDLPDIIDLDGDSPTAFAPPADEAPDDIAGLTEAPVDELTLEEEHAGDDDLLDLPEEEEIVLEDLSGADDSMPLSEDIDEIEIDFGEEEELKSEPEEAPAEHAPEEEISFDLDEDLELSPSEEEDIAATEDVAQEEELPDISDASFAAMDAEEEPEEELLDLSQEEIELPEEEAIELPTTETFAPRAGDDATLPDDLKSEIRSVLKYMDQLLESLPEDKIEEFARSEYFDTYKRLFEELGLAT